MGLPYAGNVRQTLRGALRRIFELQSGVMARLTLALLGSPRLERDGQSLTADTRKALALLAYLALEGAQSRHKLAALFWPDSAEDKAHGALRRTLSALNKALTGQGLTIERETVAADSATLGVDVLEFRARLKQGAWAEAAALYRDDFMAGFTLKDSAAFDDWQFLQAETLRREFALVLENLVRARPENALNHARRWLQLDPLHEPAHRALMQLYAEAGQHAAALRQYQECARILQTELGVSPLAETTQLYEVIKHNRGAGEWGSRWAKAKRYSPAHSPTRPPATLPFVGRSHELAALTDAYGPGRLLAIEGEAGIGKTRLAEELVEGVRRLGAVCLTVRCFARQATLAYGPFIEAGRAALAQPPAEARLKRLAPHHRAEAARLLPELRTPALPEASPLDSPGAQSRFFEGVRQWLLALCAGPAPGLLLVDDAQWLDEASLDLLDYFARRLTGKDGALTVLLTWRGEDTPPEHRLRALLAEAERAGRAHAISLARLQLADVHQLAQSAASGLPSALADRLYRETEGSPLFVVEYLKALSSNPELNADWPLPPTVRDLLATRLATLSEVAQQTLTAAAIIGRSFDAETVQAASGRSEDETVTALEELVARGHIRETRAVSGQPSAVAYDFNHDKLRALAYDQTSLVRRRLLHRRVAAGLAQRSRSAPAGVIARHYQLGGEDALAARYYRLAGDQARALYAHAEALTAYELALALGADDPAALHERCGDLHTLAGDYARALASYEAAAASAPPEQLAELERKLANVYDRRGEWDLADAHFQAALAAWNTIAAPPAALARLHAEWSRAAHHRGLDSQAEDLAQQALAHARAAGAARALAQAHNMLGLLASHRGDRAQAQALLEESLKLAEALHDPEARIAALNNLALACKEAGDLARAVALTEAALELCAPIGDRHREAALHNNLADLHHARGEAAASMHHLTAAVRRFAEIGGERAHPEIWKLTDW
jgi:DNA-binding SARP family transcriptional activator